MTKEPQSIQKLLAAEPLAFPREREKLNAPLKQGVYMILDPHGNVAHVGRTLRGKRGTLRGIGM